SPYNDYEIGPRYIDVLRRSRHRRERQLGCFPTRFSLAADHRLAITDLQGLDAGDAWKVERVGDPYPDLVAGAVGGLIAEHHEVVAAPGGALGLDRLDDRRGGRDRIPLAAIGFEQDGALDAQRHRVAQLVDGGLGSQGEHGRTATVLLDQPHRFLDRALLVRADGKPEVAGIDFLAIRAERDMAGRRRHALDADQDIHGDRPLLTLDAGVLRVEHRRWSGHSHRDGILLAEILDPQPGPHPGLLWRQEAHQDRLPHRRTRTGARHVRATAVLVDQPLAVLREDRLAALHEALEA